MLTIHFQSGIVDAETLEQLKQIDEDGEFRETIIHNYFDQAETTFKEMDEAFANREFDKLANLGHYLKGSSAAIGVLKVKASCERIQHCNQTSLEIPSSAKLEEMANMLNAVRSENAEAREYIKKHYGIA